MTKAEAIDISTFFAGVQGSVGENVQAIGWGSLTTPTVYQEVWYKFLLPNYYEVYNCTVWNIGGPYYVMWPPLDDEMMPPDPARPGYGTPCIVTLYDATDNVITVGKHIQFTSQGRFNTWLYFKVTQPEPHWSGYYGNIYCESKFRIERMSRGSIVPGNLMIQGVDKIAVVQPDNYLGRTSPLYNYVFPELSGHSVGGGAGDVLLTGVNCIQDSVAGGVSVRSKHYLAAVTFPIGTTVYNITCNADRINDFWVSYTQGGANICRPIHIHAEGQFPYSPVSCSLGTPLGITAVVDRLRARANQVLYYVEQGSYDVKVWDIQNNVALPNLAGNPGLGVVTDILIIPGGNVLVGYNTGTVPTTYTIRTYDGVTGAFIRDYVFYSNGPYNRINYTEDNNFIMLWTHEQNGLSTFRRVNVNDGAVNWTVHSKEYENNALVLDQELYQEIPYSMPSAGIPQYATQANGPESRYNFWVHPVYVFTNANSTNGEGIMHVNITGIPPDDEFYPIYFPPYLPDGTFDPTPPYPGYPWTPPPLPLPGDPPLRPPNIMPLPVKIGGGLILLDPQNTARTDQYQSRSGEMLNVPIKMNIRTAYLGD